MSIVSIVNDLRNDATGPDHVQERELPQSSLHSPSQHARRATSAPATASRASARTPLEARDEADVSGTGGSQAEQWSVSAEPSADETLSEVSIDPDLSQTTGRSVVVWLPKEEAETPDAALPAEPLNLGLTIGALIEAYHADPLSGFHKLRYHVRCNHAGLHRRIYSRYGAVPVASITGRMLIGWHADWLGADKKIAMAHGMIAQLRTIFGFGFTLLSDHHSERASRLLSKLKFPQAGIGTERLTTEQADAIRARAHIIGWHSIAFAQAMQSDGILRQKDVIGEWVPIGEPGDGTEIWGDQKWLRGIRWSEIDDNLILRHVTSKRLKSVEIDLKLSPMIMEELEYFDEIPDGDEPLVICETSGMPWVASEFRRKWRILARYAGVPDSVKSMHSRHGGISEAFEAGVNGERIKTAATHSDIGITMRYNRGDNLRASSEVMLQRASTRRPLDTDARDTRWHDIQSADFQPISAAALKARKTDR